MIEKVFGLCQVCDEVSTAYAPNHYECQKALVSDGWYMTSTEEVCPNCKAQYLGQEPPPELLARIDVRRWRPFHWNWFVFDELNQTEICSGGAVSEAAAIDAALECLGWAKNG